MNEQEYSFLKSRIYKITNLDLDCYKAQQIRRRLEAFITRLNLPTVAAYCSMLEKSADMQRELLDYLAINVSEFFRDTKQFVTLQNLVLPQKLDEFRRLNIWSAACSCGQEPYTIAMILEELAPQYYHRILATDIDESALKQARNGGPYIPYDVRNVPAPYLNKYFTKNESGYWVVEKLKRKVIFQRHNLLNDPFETNFDMIVCRNVIIYFSEQVRDNLFLKFQNSLKPNGVLFLGGSEVVLRPAQHGFGILFPAFYRKLSSEAAGLESMNHLLNEVTR
jgi:chemotaxis protein methyltransferase CheR